jgi:putative addiction module killer protein
LLLEVFDYPVRRIPEDCGAQLADGNFGDCKPLRDGVWELRIDYGPGYRVYYAMVGRTCVLLLCGGDKRKQSGRHLPVIQFWERETREIAIGDGQALNSSIYCLIDVGATVWCWGPVTASYIAGTSGSFLSGTF